jgi:hypothetical protein
MKTIVAIMLALALPVTGAWGQRAPASPFPHEKHERLFPLCESCHAGIVTGDARTSMPPEASCRECHNGTDARAVTWRRPQQVVDLLRYSHPEHARQVDSTGRACATCHNAANTTRMQVSRAAPAQCLTCHTHRASEHLGDDNRCATCHVSLTQATGLTTEAVAALPKPPSHGRPDFASAHAPITPVSSASCATCHARESCSRCHVNSSSQPLIAALGRDHRVARLMAGKSASYPVPADHHSDTFTRDHGARARENSARCATCHARPSCTTCHVGGATNPVIASMPLVERGGAPGVSLRLIPMRRRAISLTNPPATDTIAQSPRAVRVHEAGFRLNHTAEASSSMSCAGCHEQQFCSSCHAGESTRRFHAANFVQRHAADSWGRETQCSSCHNTELFCRSCHRESGLASRGRLDVAFHNAQPQWLLQHGRAARQGLQSCATCHAQRDCLTCHSTIGWGVNPHGAGFKAGRMADRNATQCLLCHLRVPGR